MAAKFIYLYYVFIKPILVLDFNIYIAEHMGSIKHMLASKPKYVFIRNTSCLILLESSGGSINRKLDCSARFGPSSDQSILLSIARSLPSDNENKHDETAAILKDTSDRRDTL